MALEHAIVLIEVKLFGTESVKQKISSNSEKMKVKALFTRDILTHNIARKYIEIKKHFSSKKNFPCVN